MKVIFDNAAPVMLAHGGAQIQIEQTKAGLESIGVEVEYMRWWDKTQRGDLIHYFGTASNYYLNLARTTGKPVVMTTLFTAACNRSDTQLQWQGRVIKAALKFPAANGLKNQLNWGTYARATRNVVGLECERFVLEKVFHVSAKNISVVPLGLPDIYLRAGPGRRQAAHLICTGTITQRKNCLELAEMARAAQTPVLFVGRPYSETDAYWLRFKKLVDGKLVKHQPHTDSQAEMVGLLQAARGFVLMSDYENWCLSAHEAVACGLPLLVQDQKWSRERFGDQISCFQRIGNNPENVETLKQFYAAAPGLHSPAIKLHSWVEVAQELKSVYERVLD